MILRYSTWEKIREQFTEEEKADIRLAITGEIICPRGWSVEVANIAEPLRGKFGAAIAETKP